jgi:hypothetical protein
MAIKIDLLPEYVPLRRRLKWTVSACVVALAGTAALLAVIYQAKTLELETLQTNVDNATRVATLSANADAATKKAIAEAAPQQAVIDFVFEASKTGAQRAALLNLVRQYIYPQALIASIDISDGKNVNIQGTVKSTDEYAAFVNTLRAGSADNGGVLYTGLPSASGPTGFPAGAQLFTPPLPDPSGQPVVLVFPIKVQAQGTLKNPVTVPVEPPQPTDTAAAPAPGAPPAH